MKILKHENFRIRKNQHYENGHIVLICVKVIESIYQFYIV